MKAGAAARGALLLGACAACLASPPASGQTRPPVRAVNVSTGDTDTSRTETSAQTRWVEDGRHHGVFMAGGMTPAALRGEAAPASGALLVVVTEEASGSVRAVAGTPEVVRATGWTVPLLHVAERRFRRLARFETGSGSSDGTPLAASPAPAAPKGHPGSVMSGSPARSEDSGARVLQASWRDGARIEGRFGRGDWRGEQLSSARPGTWLVVFDHDESTGRTRMLALAGADGERLTRYTVDGREAPVTREVLAWAAGVLERTPGA